MGGFTKPGKIGEVALQVRQLQNWANKIAGFREEWKKEERANHQGRRIAVDTVCERKWLEALAKAKAKAKATGRGRPLSRNWCVVAPLPSGRNLRKHAQTLHTMTTNSPNMSLMLREIYDIQESFETKPNHVCLGACPGTETQLPSSFDIETRTQLSSKTFRPACTCSRLCTQVLPPLQSPSRLPVLASQFEVSTKLCPAKAPTLRGTF